MAEKKNSVQDVSYGIRLPIELAKFYVEKSDGAADAPKEEKWIVEGLAASLGKDRNRPLYELTDECLKECVTDLYTNSVLFLEHDRTDPIGRIMEAKHIQGQGIWIKAMVSKTADKVWKLIAEQVLTGFSIGGRILKFTEEKKEDSEEVAYQVHRMELMEVSVVALPANIKTRIWENYVSKAFDLKIPLGGGDMMEKDTQAAQVPAEPVAPAAPAVPVAQPSEPVAPVEKAVETPAATPAPVQPEPVVKAAEPVAPAPVAAVEVPAVPVVKASDPAPQIDMLMAAIQALTKSIEEVKAGQITKDNMKTTVEEVLKTALPEELKKSAIAIKSEDAPVTTANVHDQLSNVLRELEKEV